MLLIKQVGVFINILNCRMKKHFAEMFKTKGINLTAEQYLVMDTLWDEGKMSQQSIANLIQKDKNSVTQFIDTLETKGLVFRTVDKTDRRVNNIEVSEAGQNLKESTTEVAIDTMKEILKDISEADLQTFVNVLCKMNENIKSISF
jgi:Transcriptional regulators